MARPVRAAAAHLHSRTHGSFHRHAAEQKPLPLLAARLAAACATGLCSTGSDTRQLGIEIGRSVGTNKAGRAVIRGARGKAAQTLRTLERAGGGTHLGRQAERTAYLLTGVYFAQQSSHSSLLGDCFTKVHCSHTREHNAPYFNLRRKKSTHTLRGDQSTSISRLCGRGGQPLPRSPLCPQAMVARCLRAPQDVRGEVYEDLGRGGWAWTRLVVVDVRCEAGDSEVLIAGTNLSG